MRAAGWRARRAICPAGEDDNHFWITASSCPRRLDELDFLLVRVRTARSSSACRPENKPSAERTLPFIARSIRCSERAACLHGHSVDAVRRDRAKQGARALRLAPIEMIKVFDIWKQNRKGSTAACSKTSLDVSRIAEDICSASPKPRRPSPRSWCAPTVRPCGARACRKPITALRFWSSSCVIRRTPAADFALNGTRFYPRPIVW